MKSDIISYPSIPTPGTRAGRQTFTAAELDSIRRHTLRQVRRADARATALVFDSRSTKRVAR
jgi:hypothetical protein